MTIQHAPARSNRVSNDVQSSGMSWFQIYVWTISAVGIGLIVRASLDVPNFDSLRNFLLLAALIVATQFATETLPISGKAAVTFTVSAAVSIAAIPLFGVYAAVLLEAISGLTVWLIKPRNAETWKKSVSQLTFNVGMICLSMFIVGHLFDALGLFIPSTVTQPIANSSVILWFLPRWLLIAIVYDQINLLIFIVVLRLQHGRGFSVFDMWRDSRWASLIHIFNTFFGGGVLVLAARYFDWLGIAVFFVPIFLSAYAFRVYVMQTRMQMAKMEQTIVERTQALEKLNHEKDAFLAVLSHDMKSPLTTISTYAQMLQQQPDLIHQKPRWMGNILQAQGMLTQLVNNIVDLEKLQVDGRIPLEKSTFDLNELIEYVVESIRPIADDKQIEISTHSRVDKIFIHADRTQIQRVITNLVSNAIKYTQDGGKVGVAALLDKTSVGVFVVDNGYGISASELPYVFDRFHRVESHRKVAAGTGLGLAITKAIVEGHGGVIDVTSKEGTGSRFSVQLPIDLEHASFDTNTTFHSPVRKP